MGKHIGDEYDSKIIELNTEGLKKQEIAARLGLSFDQIHLRGQKLKLEFYKPIDLEPHLQDIIKLREEKQSLRKIAKLYGTNHVAMSTFLAKHDQSTEMFRHQFNHQFFDKIDTEEKAYFLGIMLSDGTIKWDGVAINMTDKDILEKFKIAVGYDGAIRVILPLKPHHKIKYEINLYSVYMMDILAKYNVVGNKSLTLKFPDKALIHDDMIRHVIRGIFDGDGGFVYDKCNNKWDITITGTKEILEGIHALSPVKGHFYHAGKKVNKNTWQWRIRAQEDVVSFVGWIYSDSHVKMNRKVEESVKCLKDLCQRLEKLRKTKKP